MVNDLNEVISEDVRSIISSNIPWKKLSNKSVLITGSSGFLPSYFIYTFLALNDLDKLQIKVYALVRDKNKGHKKFQRFLSRKDFKLLIQDVCEPIDIQEKIDFIIHAASQASPKFYGVDPVGTLSANVIGTSNLLKLALKNQVEAFLYFSSSEVYGSLPANRISISENDYGYIDPTNVRACYAESKRMGETICVSWMHQYKIPVSIVRPFHTYGPGLDMDDGRVYSDFIADIVNNRNIIMKSDGSAVRAFCYVSDAIEAFLLVLLTGERGSAYNIGNDTCELSILQLAEELVALYPEKKLKVIKKEAVEEGYIKSLVSYVSPDIKKIKGLGWQPTTRIKEGFSRTIKSYK